MKAVLLLDYATFNFEAGSMTPSKLGEIVLNDDLRFKSVGLSENSPRVSPFGVSWLQNSGFSARPHRVQFSGVGCSHFEPLLPVLRESATNHLSRLDFAFDVVIKKKDWVDFVANAFKESCNSERIAKKITIAGSGQAMTVYIGSRRCAKYCRIYNKSLENPNYELPVGGFVADDEYLIRYEVEFKRFKGKGQDFDPSFLFDSYFSDQSTVIEFVKDVWRLYGEEFLLPCPVDDLELVCRYDKEYKFCSNDELHRVAEDHLYDSPRVYDSTVSYIVSKFGKYIPLIIADPLYRGLCLQACENYCGFKLDLVVGCSESAFYDLDENESEVSFSFLPMLGVDSEQLYIENFKGGDFSDRPDSR